MLTRSHIAPIADIVPLSRTLDRFFEESFVWPSLFSSVSNGPAVDLYETSDGYVVEVVVPGMHPDHLNLSVQENTLTIRGSAPQDNESKQGYLVRERGGNGSFVRSLTFPTAINDRKITASLRDGILTILVPKGEQAKPKQIKINTKR